VKSKVIKEYGNDVEPLKMVAINDGAKDIRTMLMAVFGVLIVIIPHYNGFGGESKYCR
jgi:hypothetical protein